MAVNEVKAILTAEDRNYTSTMKKAMGVTEGFGSKVKAGLGFGALMKIGSSAISLVGNQIKGLVTEINSTNAAWKTFRSNMQMIGKGDEVEGIQKRLQRYAAQTVYSSSDMANTFAQLEAVGVKSTEELVIGFGNLAAAAENPKQAMKTLSTQGTQMAAKPMVTWQDFKLMLEQTPAGIAQVAKAMGKTTAELVKDVQDGKVKTEEFFNAVKDAGANEQLQKMATTYKTLGQAADGLQDSIAQKLAPSFDKLSQVGINSISKLIDVIDGVDLDKYLNASSFGDGFVMVITDMVKSVTDALPNIATKFEELTATIGEKLVDFVPLGADLVGNLIQGIAENAPRMIIAAASMIGDFLWGVASKLPSLIATGLNAITKFIEGLASGRGTLLTSATQIIQEFGKQLIANLPAIATAALKLMLVLVKTIATNIPMIVATAGKLLISFVKTIISYIPRIAAAGTSAMRSLGTAVWNGIVKVASKARAGAAKIPSMIRSGLGSLVSIGRNLIEGLWSGIKAKFDSVIARVKEKAAALPTAVKKVLGIASPSKVMKKLGTYTGEGFAIGIESTYRQVQAAMGGLYGLQPAGALGGTINAGMNDAYSYQVSARYEVIVPVELNGREIARASANDMQEAINQLESRQSRKVGIR